MDDRHATSRDSRPAQASAGHRTAALFPTVGGPRCIAGKAGHSIVPAGLLLGSLMLAVAAARGGGPSSGTQGGLVNPYAAVDWDTVAYLPSFSHQHGNDPGPFWEMGFRHLPLSNYYPSRPLYPLPPAFAARHPDALGAPNAEQHSTTDSGVHFCALGSYYTTGYGRTPRIAEGQAPVEHVFTDLNVFDPDRSPWLGVYRLDVRIAPRPGASGEPSLMLSIDGATEISHKTFSPLGNGRVTRRRLTASSPESTYLRTDSDRVRVRLEFDPAVTRITRFRLMQGTNRPWRDAFRAALDGTLTDGAGRPVEGLLFPDGGGITINHPSGSAGRLLEMLDFDPRVLGIEVWNQHERFGGPSMRFYRLWDEALRAGRRCFGFFVKDHVLRGSGRNVLLVAAGAPRTRTEREREALRAYREGRFFGAIGAVTTDSAGRAVPPYDHTDFRFTRIALVDDDRGQPAAIDVSVGGADRGRRPNTQLRFVTEAGLARVADADRARFELPRAPSGAVACRYVRIEAFAYPHTHLGGTPLTATAMAAMNVHEISRLHDRLGDIMPGVLDPPGQTPIPIVDMLFSQPILFPHHAAVGD